jgi:hypothetical protein
VVASRSSTLQPAGTHARVRHTRHCDCPVVRALSATRSH